MAAAQCNEIRDKVQAGRRLTGDDALALFESADLHELGMLADLVRRRRHGDKAYYVVNRHINYSNVCRLVCTVCTFGRPEGDEAAYELSIEQIAALAAQAAGNGAREIHITGGLHPCRKIEHYERMLTAVRAAGGQLTIKAFTAAEIDNIAGLSAITISQVISRLMAAGLDCLPGGGAEIFDRQIRDKLFPGKISGNRWLEIHRQAHKLGLKSNATMLYGQMEKPGHRIGHLLELRNLQDETGGFQAFVPLRFSPPAGEKDFVAGGLDDLKTIAVSRLLLDNFEHIKTFWIMHSLKLSQVALAFGADDIDGTVGQYEITNSQPCQSVSPESLEKLIREAGFVPVRRDGFYREVTGSG